MQLAHRLHRPVGRGCGEAPAVAKAGAQRRCQAGGGPRVSQRSQGPRASGAAEGRLLLRPRPSSSAARLRRCLLTLARQMGVPDVLLPAPPSATRGAYVVTAGLVGESTSGEDVSCSAPLKAVLLLCMAGTSRQVPTVQWRPCRRLLTLTSPTWQRHFGADVQWTFACTFCIRLYLYCIRF